MGLDFAAVGASGRGNSAEDLGSRHLDDWLADGE